MSAALLWLIICLACLALALAAFVWMLLHQDGWTPR